MKQADWLKLLTKRCATNKELWQVLTSLRGPDNMGSMLKWFTTARIRAIIGVPMKHYGTPTLEFISIDVNKQPLEPQQISQRNYEMKNLRIRNHHFVEHYKNAIRVLKKIGYDVSDAELDFDYTWKVSIY